MMPLILYALALFGGCYIVGQSQITLLPRQVLLGILIHRVRGRPAKWYGSRRAFEMKTSVRDGNIVHPFKLIVDLLQCPACLSTWIGLALAWRWPALAAAVAAPLPVLARPIPFALLSCGLAAIISFATGVMNASE